MLTQHGCRASRLAVLPLLLMASCGEGPVLPTTAAGATSPPPGGKADEATVAAAARVPALRSRDFGFVLDRQTIRQTQPHLSDRAFDAKWEAALETPLLFLRSFPAAYHLELGVVAAARVPAGESLCFGDAHVGNFGFLRRVGKKLVYNDLDDSGYCPLAIDALRYFVSLRLAFDDDDLTDQIIDTYLDALKDASTGPSLDKDLEPDWGEVADHRADEDLDGSSELIARTDEVQDVSAAEADALLDLFARDPWLSSYDLLDLAATTPIGGGSGGLRRFWVLVDRASASPSRTIIELKQATLPAVDWGRHQQSLDFATRLDPLKRAFWRGPVTADNFYVTLGGAFFLVRDRFARVAPDPLELGDKELQNLLEVEALELARGHRALLGGLDKGHLRSWLTGSSATVADRWLDLYDRAF